MKKRWLTVPALVAVAALALPGIAQARWKTLNGPLIQTTGTNLCVCKDGLRVNVGRFRGDGIPWDALRLVVTTLASSTVRRPSSSSSRRSRPPARRSPCGR